MGEKDRPLIPRSQAYAQLLNNRLTLFLFLSRGRFHILFPTVPKRTRVARVHINHISTSCSSFSSNPSKHEGTPTDLTMTSKSSPNKFHKVDRSNPWTQQFNVDETKPPNVVGICPISDEAQKTSSGWGYLCHKHVCVGWRVITWWWARLGRRKSGPHYDTSCNHYRYLAKPWEMTHSFKGLDAFFAFKFEAQQLSLHHLQDYPS